MKKCSFLLAAFIVFLIPSFAFAQEYSSGVAVSIPMQDKSAQDGSIVSGLKGKYVLSNEDYDTYLYGVIVKIPAVGILATNITESVPVITSGKAYVLVSSKNGQIKNGDYITSSTQKGVGQKANKIGYVLGTAIGNYSNSDAKKIGKVLIVVNPHFNSDSATSANLLANLKLAASSPFLNPLTALRYLMAVIVATLAFVLGFYYFGRISKTGVEALGRNPLAGSQIRVTILFNIGLTIVIMLIGLALAYMILVL